MRDREAYEEYRYYELQGCSDERPHRHSCGGLGSYRGPCGAIDCPSCNPGGYDPGEEELEEDD